MKIIVTGGAGFIGSNLIRLLLKDPDNSVLNIDKLTYAGRLENLLDVSQNENYQFKRLDICDFDALSSVVESFKPTLVFHLAAESHVDRSIDGASEFVHTNVVGTYCIVEAAYQYWTNLPLAQKDQFKFIHISTDEVYGALGDSGQFNEESPYKPNSPYAATKASSDMLVRSYNKTFGFPSIISNCSNNFGPYQFPEKLIPLCVLNGLEGKPLPIYGQGDQVRDWLYVEDHTRALKIIGESGIPGEVYCIGGNNERKNKDVVHSICQILDEIKPNTNWGSHETLIQYVQDRPGHDKRYAINSTKIIERLGWKPTIQFSEGLRKTIHWYIKNSKWWGSLRGSNEARNRRGLKEGAVES